MAQRGAGRLSAGNSIGPDSRRWEMDRVDIQQQQELLRSRDPYYPMSDSTMTGGNRSIFGPPQNQDAYLDSLTMSNMKQHNFGRLEDSSGSGQFDPYLQNPTDEFRAHDPMGTMVSQPDMEAKQPRMDEDYWDKPDTPVRMSPWTLSGKPKETRPSTSGRFNAPELYAVPQSTAADSLNQNKKIITNLLHLCNVLTRKHPNLVQQASEAETVENQAGLPLDGTQQASDEQAEPRRKDIGRNGNHDNKGDYRRRVGSRDRTHGHGKKHDSSRDRKKRSGSRDRNRDHRRSQGCNGHRRNGSKDRNLGQSGQTVHEGKTGSKDRNLGQTGETGHSRKGKTEAEQSGHRGRTGSKDRSEQRKRTLSKDRNLGQIVQSKSRKRTRSKERSHGGAKRSAERHDSRKGTAVRGKPRSHESVDNPKCEKEKSNKTKEKNEEKPKVDEFCKADSTVTVPVRTSISECSESPSVSKQSKGKGKTLSDRLRYFFRRVCDNWNTIQPSKVSRLAEACGLLATYVTNAGHPHDDKTFTAHFFLSDILFCDGKGSTKEDAWLHCNQNALKKIKSNGPSQILKKFKRHDPIEFGDRADCVDSPKLYIEYNHNAITQLRGKAPPVPLSDFVVYEGLRKTKGLPATILDESAKMSLALLKYVTEPFDKKLYRCRVYIEGSCVGHGDELTRNKSKQEAAKSVLNKLRRTNIVIQEVEKVAVEPIQIHISTVCGHCYSTQNQAEFAEKVTKLLKESFTGTFTTKLAVFWRALNDVEKSTLKKAARDCQLSTELKIYKPGSGEGPGRYVSASERNEHGEEMMLLYPRITREELVAYLRENGNEAGGYRLIEPRGDLAEESQDQEPDTTEFEMLWTVVDAIVDGEETETIVTEEILDNFSAGLVEGGEEAKVDSNTGDDANGEGSEQAEKETDAAKSMTENVENEHEEGEKWEDISDKDVPNSQLDSETQETVTVVPEIKDDGKVTAQIESVEIKKAKPETVLEKGNDSTVCGSPEPDEWATLVIVDSCEETVEDGATDA